MCLVGIWGFSFLFDQVWFALDNSIPAWDQSEYLNGVMLYQEALKNPRWLDGDWWRDFWLLSKKVPPGMYIITAFFFFVFGASVDTGSLVLSLFNFVLLVSLFFLGKLFFNQRVALFACILSQLIPGLYYYRREFLLDFPLASLVTFAFTSLSYWYFSVGNSAFWGIILGISLGLCLLLKQTSLFFLLFPMIYVFLSTIICKLWLKLCQFTVSLLVAAVFFCPWYRTNWLTIFTAGKRATIDSAIVENEPPLNTLKAWTLYAESIPYILSSFLFIISLGFGAYWLLKCLINSRNIISITTGYCNKKQGRVFGWMLMFFLGGYLLSSLNVNKDIRYILPLLPAGCLVISALIYSYKGRGKLTIRILTTVVLIVLMTLNSFPIGWSFVTAKLSPKMQRFPYRGKPWATREVVETVINHNPYLKTNIGVLPSTPEVNQYNISFYGAISGFRVFGREVGVKKKYISEDIKSLDWFLTKTGYQGPISDSQREMIKKVEKSEKFRVVNTWNLPDGSELRLFHSIEPKNEVKMLDTRGSQLRLEGVLLPREFGKGEVIPVNYQWVGSWDKLINGILIIDWVSVDNPEKKWIHDHRLGCGELYDKNSRNLPPGQDFSLTENMAMYIPENMPEGDYTLRVTYLHQKTGETHPVAIPEIKVSIKQNSTTIPHDRELDLVSQLRLLAAILPRGIDEFGHLFSEIGRINQYDPIQDYLSVAEKTITYRLSRENNLDYLYTLLLSQVLQQKVNQAIKTAFLLVKENPDNPYNHAYLSFLYLYDWRGKQGEKAIDKAIAIQPGVKEFWYLKAISNFMQGDFIGLWWTFHQFKTLLPS